VLTTQENCETVPAFVGFLPEERKIIMKARKLADSMFCLLLQCHSGDMNALAVCWCVKVLYSSKSNIEAELVTSRDETKCNGGRAHKYSRRSPNTMKSPIRVSPPTPYQCCEAFPVDYCRHMLVLEPIYCRGLPKDVLYDGEP
jgi:hypothetical protein